MTRSADEGGGSVDAAGIIDFHNHIVPGVDDGARGETDARDALAAMSAEGVSIVVVSPHVDASIALRRDRMDERMGELDAGWARLQAILSGFPELEVRRGAEVKLDTPEPDLSDDRFRIAGGRFVLFEFPYFTIPPRSAPAFALVRAQGWIPIVAHPERYPGIRSDLDVVTEWRAAGAYLQLNGPSLTGRYGDEARAAGIAMLENGWVDYLSSDYHARGKPDISAYRHALAEAGGEEQVTLLTETNPERLLRNEAPLPVPPLVTRRTLWDRIAAPFR